MTTLVIRPARISSRPVICPLRITCAKTSWLTALEEAITVPAT